MNFIHLVLDDHVSFLCAYLPRELQAERPRRQIVESSAVAESAWITDAALSAEQLAEIFDAYRQRLRAFRDQGGSGIGGPGTPDVGAPAPGTGVGVYKSQPEVLGPCHYRRVPKRGRPDNTKTYLGRRREGRERLRHLQGPAGRAVDQIRDVRRRQVRRRAAFTS